jgi:tRNA-splicing ligase RtcB
MPDVHWGNGATVGSVIVQQDALSPAVVGVDIGCGMMAYQTIFTLDSLGGDKGLKVLRASIERSIPVGFNSNKEVTKRVAGFISNLGKLSERGQKFFDKASLQLGTLGGGNHFIEVCLDTTGKVWIMLHSGSRNIGKELAEYHIHKAQGLIGELAKKYPSITDSPIPKELAALIVGTQAYNDYIEYLFWCQGFSKSNREEMMLRVLKDLSYHVYKEERLWTTFVTNLRVQCHHNYISKESTEFGMASLVTRKGAVSAKAGELGIIPGSMGAKSFIVKGKGNADSYCSCSHGAGRKMSRSKAKKVFTVKDLEEQTSGVECRKDTDVLDEIPGAYKDIQEVMDSQKDLVEVVAELKQILCVKG